jgi:asparagine synthase (glutamine-hydrolysing)
MCGIAGFVPTNKIPNSRDALSAMLTRIHHRGPDEAAMYLSDYACIGSVRLSIIDLKSGQQPMCTQDGRYWITYNGEVFNFCELRELLEQKGHLFRTNCDTEVVLHMYQEFGSECLNYFNGQFALSIWDTVEHELFLARDRIGIRPLYYTQQNSGFVFSSEIKSIFEFPNVERRINEKGLDQVFTFWTTLSPNTIFQNIYEIPAGHYAIYKNGNLHTQPYWNLNFSIKRNIGFIEAKEQFASLFKDSIALRMRADVPVAAYLSGGIDSTATTAFIKKMFPGALHTFSIRFEERDFDESVYQQEVAHCFKTMHHSDSFQNKDVVDLFSKVIWHTEVPVLRTAPFPMFKLSGLVKDNGIKVVITGEGADEILGGYNIFKEALIRRFWAKFPESKIRPQLLKKLYLYIPQIKEASSSALKMFFGYKLLDTHSSIYSHLLRWNNTSRITKHFSEELKEQVREYNPINSYEQYLNGKLNGYSPLAKAQYIETNLFMSGYLLSSQGDRVAMGNSVEGRYPFLDHRLIEFCAGLPDDFKIKGLDEKYLLKNVVKGVIPSSVLNRPKQAYRAPIAQALLTDETGFVDEYLSDLMLNRVGVFNSKSVGNLVLRLRNNSSMISEIDNMALMGILSTQVLHELYINGFEQLKPGEYKLVKIMNANYAT